MAEDKKKDSTIAQSGRDVEPDLDLLDIKISELKVEYEQYFLDIITQPPDKLFDEVVRLIKVLQNAPFKNSVTRFRLNTLTTRFQTYKTYWEKVKKQREEGTYKRDIFKAKLRT